MPAPGQATLMPLTVGTAGHIDHGKTWLVRALTGKDTDRLPEEQRRGISIDLGYAPLELADGRRLSVIDVPGHERFVRTMVAGATGIDLFLLVIDAGEGARPQTHEHLAILRLLGIERGVVALTKVDAVDAETVELAEEEARELVPGAEVVRVSARTGEGLDELRAALARVADSVEHARADAADAAVRRPLVLDPGLRHRRDGDALVGLDRRRRPAPARAVGPRRARAERPGARPRRRARGGRPARRGEPSRGRARTTWRGARRSSRRARIRSRTASTSCSRSSSRSRTTRACTCTSGRRTSRPGSCALGERFAQLRLDRARRRRSRRPRDPPRRDDARRWHACSTRRLRGIATSARLELLARGRRRGDDRRARARRRAAPRARRRARRRRARGAVGRSRRRGSPGSKRISALASPPPTRSTPACRCPRDALGRRRAPAPAARAARLEALPPRRRRRRSTGVTRTPRRSRRELAGAGVRATKVDDDELARFLEASGRLVRLGDGYAIGAEAFEVAKDVLLAECRGGGRDHARRASATSSARAVATRSSCSSGSTRTG